MYISYQHCIRANMLSYIKRKGRDIARCMYGVHTSNLNHRPSTDIYDTNTYDIYCTSSCMYEFYEVKRVGVRSSNDEFKFSKSKR